MAEDRTVLEHLLEGRDALQREVTRLNAAIEQLDAVVDRLGSMGISGVMMNGPDEGEPDETVTSTPDADVSSTERVPATSTVRSQPLSSPDTVRSARAPRKAPAKKASRPRQQQSEAPKSIRVHVLELLSADNREYGLAEIIDSVHDAGIQAHDDAVRSITIKLMKDGRVERVGRGQYRLARRGRATSTASRTAEPAATSSAPDRSAAHTSAPTTTEDAAPPTAETDTAETLADETLTAETVDEATDENATDDGAINDGAINDGAINDGATDDGSAAGESGSDDAAAASEPAEPAAGEQSGTRESGGYTPPLNLGQPWG